MPSLRETYVQATREALLDSGRRLFVTRPYAEISAESLVDAAHLSRGALYHHFDGKRGLFEAIFDEFESTAAQQIRSAIDAEKDLFGRADSGAQKFLDICTDDAYRHVVLLQGPIALGWSRWREIDQRHLGGIVVAVFVDLLEARLIKPHRVDLLAAAFYGALTELSMSIAESDHPASARAEAGSLQRDLLAGLRPLDR